MSQKSASTLSDLVSAASYGFIAAYLSLILYLYNVEGVALKSHTYRHLVKLLAFFLACKLVSWYYGWAAVKLTRKVARKFMYRHPRLCNRVTKLVIAAGVDDVDLLDIHSQSSHDGKDGKMIADC